MLTEREQQVIEFMKAHRQQNNCLPSARQIGAFLGFKSSRSAQNYIDALKAKGFLRHRVPTTNSYALPDEAAADCMRKITHGGESIPLFGAVAAGLPLTGFSDCDRAIQVPSGFFGDAEELFALQVIGNSMSGDNICAGDIVIVKRQRESFGSDTILAIRVGSDEFTLKRVRSKGEWVELVSSNVEYPVIEVHTSRIEIEGKYVGLLRRC